MIYRDLQIGRAASGEVIKLDADARRRNILMVGPPGTGKSSALEDQARQIITNDEGFFLLDGDGAIYDRLVTWCAEYHIDRRRPIHLIDLREERWSVGLDGLRIPPRPPATPYSASKLDAVRIARIDAVVAGIEQIFGEDSRHTPRLRRCLRSACYALAVNELTLAELEMLTTASDISGARQALTANLPNQTFRAVWSDLNRLKPDAYQDQFESAVNRIAEVLGYPMVRRMLGQRRHVLDFRQAMDRGEAILCRAAAQEDEGVSWHGARLVGTLLTTEMILGGLGRDEKAGYDRPFNVMIDEAAQFLTPAVEFALDRLRKRGVHFTFAIQRLGHLKDAGDSVYDAVMQDAQTKIIFRQVRDQPAEELATELFRPEFNLSQPKLTAPATTGHYIEILTSETVSEGAGGARIAVESEGTSDIETGNWGHSMIDVTANQMHWDGAIPAGMPDGLGRSRSVARGDIAGGARGTARQHGRSAATVENWNQAVARSARQALIPRIEWITVQLKPLPEVIHDHIVVLRQLDDREAIVKSLNRPTVRIRTLDVKPAYAMPRLLAKFTQEVYEKSAYTSSLAAIEQETAERHERIAQMAGTSSAADSSDEPGPPPFEAPKWE